MRIRRLQAQNFKHLDEIDLVFPPRGTFLIQGHNEAGKSSLFEAIFFALFAKPLQASRIEELIRYGGNIARVYLEVELPRTELRVERVIRRGKGNQWKLRVGEELVVGREVNKRIEEELHLDADALLNSCFVEQKGLEKLEGLQKSARESAVMKLLNLEKMQMLEETVRVKREDEKELEQLKKKVRLAEIEEELPRLQKEIDEWERMREFWEVKELLRQAEERRKMAKEEEEELPTLQRRKEEIQQKVEELREAKDLGHKVNEILSNLRLWEEKGTHIERMEKELEEIWKAKESIPQQRDLKRKLFILLRGLKRLENLRGLAQRVREWLGITEKIKTEEGVKELLEEERKNIQEHIAKGEENIRMLEWRERKRSVEGKIERQARLSQQLQQVRPQIIGCSLFALFFLLLLLSPIKWLSFLSLVPLLCLFHLIKRRESLQKEIGRLEGEIHSALPEGVDIKIPPELEERNLEEEKRNLEASQRRLKEVEGQIHKVEGNMEALMRQREEMGLGIGEEEKVRKDLAKMESIAQRWETLLERKAGALKVRLTSEDINRQINFLEADINNKEKILGEEAPLLKRKEKEEAESKGILERIKAELPRFRGRITNVFAREEWERLRREYKEKQDKLERMGVEESLRRVEEEIASVRKAIELHKQEADKLERSAQEKLEELEGIPPDLPSLEEINRNLDERRARVLQLQRERENILQEIVIGENLPTLEELREDLRKKERELQIRRYAVAIFETARRNITQKVLPRTLDHMWRILPLLTNDRYRQVELDPETFKMRVYDERAEDWKDKNIFSGGARDQMSLALRLSFALAALPQERSASPSFLFLDEPLSSFDENRREALIRVITQGEIAEAFAQIFVISHTPLLNPNLFNYYLVMEEGRIKECSEELIPPEKRFQRNL